MALDIISGYLLTLIFPQPEQSLNDHNNGSAALSPPPSGLPSQNIDHVQQLPPVYDSSVNDSLVIVPAQPCNPRASALPLHLDILDRLCDRVFIHITLHQIPSIVPLLVLCCLRNIPVNFSLGSGERLPHQVKLRISAPLSLHLFLVLLRQIYLIVHSPRYV